MGWRRLALPAFLGVLGLIWAAAHALAHDTVAQAGGARHDVHGAGVAAYLAYLPTSLALCLTLATAIATGAAFGKRWTGKSGRSIWLFGVAPVLGFAVDTLTEAGANGSTASAAAELVPVFLIGLLIQVPFALVAVGLAGTILWLVEQLAWRVQKAAVLARPPAAPGPACSRSIDGHGLLPTGSWRSRAPPLELAS